MKVCVLYGFTEGSWHSQRLVAELKKNGHAITKMPEEAEVIIAHSGGCYLVPEHENFKEIILVGLPYLPAKDMLKAMIKKIRLESKDAYFFKKTLHSIYYFFVKPVYWWRMLVGWKNKSLPMHESKKTLVVNHKDTFAHIHKLSELAQKYDWELHTFTGQHDDLWSNPKPYIELIGT